MPLANVRMSSAAGTDSQIGQSGAMGHRGRRGVILGCGPLVLLLSGCSPLNQGAVTLDVPSQLPMLVLSFCNNEGVEAVRLSEATLDGGVYEEVRTLWRIEAAQPQVIETVVAGEVPDGFREVVPLTADLPEDLVMMAENAVDGGTAMEQGGGFFMLSELAPGVLLQDGVERTRAGLREDAERNCSSSLFGSLGLPAWLDWVAGAAAGVAVVIGLVLVIHARSRSSGRNSPHVGATELSIGTSRQRAQGADPVSSDIGGVGGSVDELCERSGEGPVVA